MKIIISNYDDIKNPVYGGGGAISIHQIAKRLANNYSVTVITGMYENAKNEIIDGVTYQRIGSFLFGHKVGQLIFQIILPFIVLSQSFDLWIESFTPPFSTGCLQLYTKKPVIGLIHMLSGQDMYRKYKLPFHWIEQLGLKTYSYFIVLSDTTKSLIKRCNQTSTCTIIPNGVDMPTQLSMYTPQTKETIIYLGRIEINQKGLDLLLQAFQIIKEKVNYRLKIAGTGNQSELNKLSKLIHQYQLDDKVDVIGKITGEAKETFFNQARCAVLPSRYETFPLSALEIIAHGIPLISFDLPNLHWIPDDSAVRIPAFDIERLAQTIMEVCQNSRLCQNLSQHAVKTAQKFSWDDSADKYKQFINMILNTAHAH